AMGFRVNLILGTPLLSANLLDAAPAPAPILTSPQLEPPPDLLTALPFLQTAEDLFRVKLGHAPSAREVTTVTSEKEFYVQNLKGGAYLKMPARATVRLKSWNGLIYLTTSTQKRALV